jgi:uncharacterized protein (TIGR02118 family)
MTTEITIIYENPDNAEEFEAGYADQLNLAGQIPGTQRLQSSKVWPKEDGSPTPAYRLLDLYFADYEAASRAVMTAQAGEFFDSVFKLATGGVRIVFADIETT